MQENIRFNNQIQNANVAYAKLIPVIQMMAKRSDNWWSLRKRYGKLTENLIRGYILSRLRDIRLKGRAEADKAIEKIIFDKKRELTADILRFIEQNRSVWAQFLYDTASRFDGEAIVGVFVPLIYGGIISRKNSFGEMFGVVDFDEKSKQNSANELINGAVNAINELKRRGITAVVICGAPNEVYSDRLLSVYLSSPGEVFIIIEREARGNERAGDIKNAAYKREILSMLGRSKNVFIILDGEGESARGKSGALSSYGILHGFSEKTCGNVDQWMKKGSLVAIFDRSTSIVAELGGVDPMKMSADNILSAMPRSISSFVSAPSFPLRLPDVIELLLVAQFVNSCGKVSKMAQILV